MAILKREKLVSYLIELTVVVFGILIAFQVEEWREDRQRNQDLDAALVRLTEETAANLQVCDFAVSRFADHGRWAMAVVRGLNDENLHNTDVEEFETGLIRVGYIQGTPYSASVAEEMIATGLLKELESAELRSHIAALPVWIDSARRWTNDTRGSLKAAVAEVNNAVQLEYRGDLPVLDDSNAGDDSFEKGIKVVYVLEDLIANQTLKNVFIEAADTHVDMWHTHRELCRRFDEIQLSLADVARP